MARQPKAKVPDTIPPAERQKVLRDAWRHGTNTIAEHVSDPSLGPRGHGRYEPSKADTN